MASVNKVMLIGNLTRDPEIKYTPKGTAIADIGLAVNRTYTTEGGEKREEVTFIDVTLWGRVAEIVGENIQLLGGREGGGGGPGGGGSGAPGGPGGGGEYGEGRPASSAPPARPPGRQPAAPPPRPPVDPDLDAPEDDIPF